MPVLNVSGLEILRARYIWCRSVLENWIKGSHFRRARQIQFKGWMYLITSIFSAEFYFRDPPPLCPNYELTSTYGMDLWAHKCEMWNIIEWIHYLWRLFCNVGLYIWVGFLRTGIYPDIDHFLENFGGLLWPSLIS